MKKKYIYLLMAIANLSLLISYKAINKDKYILQDGVILALTLDGEEITSFPSKGDYGVDVNCTKGEGKWLYDEWKFVIENITGKAKCYLDFKTVNKEETKLNDYVVSLDGNGEVEHKTFAGSGATMLQKEVMDSSWYKGVSNTNDATNSSYVNNLFEWDENLKEWSYKVPSNIYSSNTFKVTLTFRPSESGTYTFFIKYKSNNFADVSKIYVNNSLVKTTGINAESSLIYSTDLTTSSYVKIVFNDYYSTSGSYMYKGSYVTFKAIKTDNVTEPENYDAGYRYTSVNSNNYVLYNNELWRIIGALDATLEDGTIQKLTKIIRNDSFGGVAFDGDNFTQVNFATAGIKYLLNDYYLNKLDGTSTNYCYHYGGDTDILGGTCDYSGVGLGDTSRNMLENVRWYFGAVDYYYSGAEDYCSYEKPNCWYRFELFSNYSRVGYETSVLAKVGLMNVSDALYSWNWLPKPGIERTINIDGHIDGYNVYNSSNMLINNWDDEDKVIGAGQYDSSFQYRPVVYLKDSVYILNGTGTIDNPFILSI